MGIRLTDITVSDSGFVFDPTTGQTFLLNRTGLSLVKMLQQGIPIEETPAKLEENFDMSGKQAIEDVREFISLMKEMGFKVDTL